MKTLFAFILISTLGLTLIESPHLLTQAGAEGWHCGKKLCLCLSHQGHDHDHGFKHAPVPQDHPGIAMLQAFPHRAPRQLSGSFALDAVSPEKDLREIQFRLEPAFLSGFSISFLLHDQRLDKPPRPSFLF